MPTDEELLARVAAHIDKAMECSICLDNFTDPRTLKCGHAFCREPCLGKLVQDEVDPDNAAVGDRYIRCPQCRGDHWLGTDEDVDSLPHAVIMTDLKEVGLMIGTMGRQNPSNTSGSSEPQPPPVPRRPHPPDRQPQQIPPRPAGASPPAQPERQVSCDACAAEPETAAAYCADCKKRLCARHVERHNKVSAFRGHSVRAVRSDEARAHCAAHPDRAACLYCVTCADPACDACVLDVHYDHDTTVLTEGPEQLSALERGYQEAIAATKSALDSAYAQKRTAEDVARSQRDVIQRQIGAVMTEVTRALKRQAEALTAELDRRVEGAVTGAEERQRHLTGVLVRQEALLSGVRAFRRGRPGPADLVREYHRLRGEGVGAWGPYTAPALPVFTRAELDAATLERIQLGCFELEHSPPDVRPEAPPAEPIYDEVNAGTASPAPANPPNNPPPIMLRRLNIIESSGPVNNTSDTTAVIGTPGVPARRPGVPESPPRDAPELPARGSREGHAGGAPGTLAGQSPVGVLEARASGRGSEGEPATRSTEEQDGETPESGDSPSPSAAVPPRGYSTAPPGDTRRCPSSGDTPDIHPAEPPARPSSAPSDTREEGPPISSVEDRPQSHLSEWPRSTRSEVSTPASPPSPCSSASSDSDTGAYLHMGGLRKLAASAAGGPAASRTVTSQATPTQVTSQAANTTVTRPIATSANTIDGTGDDTCYVTATVGSQQRRGLREVCRVRPGACIEIRDHKLYQNSTVVMTTDCSTKPAILKDYNNRELAVIGHGKLTDPYGLAVDKATGDIGVCDARRSVKVFDVHGELKVEFRGQYKRVMPLAWCPPVGAYVTSDWDEGSLIVLDPRTGARALRVLPSGGQSCVDPWLPVYLACDPTSTEIAAVDDTSTCVKLFDIRFATGSGCEVTSLKEPDPYNWAPAGVAIDKTGSVLVSDPMGHRVGRFINPTRGGGGAPKWEVIAHCGGMRGKFWNAVDVSARGELAIDTTSRYNDQEVTVYEGLQFVTSYGALPDLDSGDEEGYEKVLNRPDPSIIDWNIPFLRTGTPTGAVPAVRLEDLEPDGSPPPPPLTPRLPMDILTGSLPSRSAPRLSRFLSETLPPVEVPHAEGVTPAPLSRSHSVHQPERPARARQGRGKKVKQTKVKSGPTATWYTAVTERGTDV